MEAGQRGRQAVVAVAATRASSDQPRRWLLQRVEAAARISAAARAVPAVEQLAQQATERTAAAAAPNRPGVPQEVVMPPLGLRFKAGVATGATSPLVELAARMAAGMVAVKYRLCLAAAVEAADTLEAVEETAAESAAVVAAPVTRPAPASRIHPGLVQPLRIKAMVIGLRLRVMEVQ